MANLTNSQQTIQTTDLTPAQVKENFFALLEDFYKNVGKRKYVQSNMQAVESSNLWLLMNILVNKNPFIPQHSIKIKLNTENQDSAVGRITDAVFSKSCRDITIDNTFFSSILKGDVNLIELFDAIYHEQRHNSQQLAKDNQVELAYRSAFAACDLSKVYMTTKMTHDDVLDINKFMYGHNFLRRAISRSQTEAICFGSYLIDKREQDARASAYEYTKVTIDKILNDPACSNIVKQKLNSNFIEYVNDCNKRFKIEAAYMKKYLKFEAEFKKIVMDAVRGAKDLSKTQLEALSNGENVPYFCQIIFMDLIKSLPTKEKLDVYIWTIKQKDVELIKLASNNILKIDLNTQEVKSYFSKQIANNAIDTQTAISILDKSTWDKDNTLSRLFDEAFTANGNVSWFLDRLIKAKTDLRFDIQQPTNSYYTCFLNFKDALNNFILKLKQKPTADLMREAKSNEAKIRQLVELIAPKNLALDEEIIFSPADPNWDEKAKQEYESWINSFKLAQKAEKLNPSCFEPENENDIFCKTKLTELNDLIAQNEHLLEPQTDEPLGV